MFESKKLPSKQEGHHDEDLQNFSNQNLMVAPPVRTRHADGTFYFGKHNFTENLGLPKLFVYNIQGLYYAERPQETVAEEVAEERRKHVRELTEVDACCNGRGIHEEESNNPKVARSRRPPEAQQQHLLHEIK